MTKIEATHNIAVYYPFLTPVSEIEENVDLFKAFVTQSSVESGYLKTKGLISGNSCEW